MILHLDLSTGASGDKLLGALLELCESLGLTSFAELNQKVRQLLPNVNLERRQVERAGIAATHLTVAVDQHDQHEHEYEHKHEYQHDNSQHNQHSHSHNQHRHWAGIRALINTAADADIISTDVAALAIRVFERVAASEAKVHNTTPEQVHFHEVGADDSIIDIVFSSFLLDLLAPSAVYATAMALGSGTVISEHGELPVPAPATAEILAGTNTARQIPVYTSSHTSELTTPTGAALIAEFVTAFTALPCSSPLACGYGAGSRELQGAANVLRAIAAEPTSLAGLEAQPEQQLFIEGVTQLECNLDHISPEAAAEAAEELLIAGALDVWQEPIMMKKGRLAIKLVLLTKPELASQLAQKTIELTGSLGVRCSYLERTVIPRRTVVLETPYGPVPYKAAEMGSPSNRRYWLRPEHDAVAAIARAQALNYLDLYSELQALALNHH